MAKKTYTISATFSDKPFIRLTGNWLKDMGFDVNTKFEIIEGKNMIIILKVPIEQTN